MGTILIDKLLSTCVHEGASDLHLSAGAPPMMRVAGRLKSVAARTLSAADTFLLMECITPYARRQEYLSTGGADFEFGFGDACRARVSLLRARGNVAIVLRLQPSGKEISGQQG
jgi:twitching motility protein PilT